MAPRPSAVIVLTTVATAEQADKLVLEILNAHLAGCVQVDAPIESHYFWEGKLCRSTEYRCVIKTTTEALPALHRLLSEQHPYEIPQVLSLSAEASTAYLEWLRQEISPPA